jgi:phosphate starvation-inducible membrane PsiE
MLILWKVAAWKLKTAQFAPNPASTVDVTTVVRILNKVRNLQRSKKEYYSIENILVYYFIWLQFYLLQIYYFILHYMWGICHHTYVTDALLHTYVIFIAVSKRI